MGMKFPMINLHGNLELYEVPSKTIELSAMVILNQGLAWVAVPQLTMMNKRSQVSTMVLINTRQSHDDSPG